MLAMVCTGLLLSGCGRSNQDVSGAIATGKSAQERQDHTDAISDFTRALLVEPENVEALKHRAHSYLAVNNEQAALNDLRVALKLKPDWADLWYQRALVHQKYGRNASAANDLLEAIKLDDKHTKALLARGKLLLKMGDQELAIAHLASAVDCDPDDAEIRRLLADQQVEAGELRSAIGNYSHILKENPKDAAAWLARSGAHNQVGQQQFALIDLDEARKLLPDEDRQLRYRRVHLLRLLQRNEELITELQTLARDQPENMMLRREILQCAERTGNYPVIVTVSTQLLRQNDDDPALYRTRGLANHRLKRVASAIEDIGTAVRLDGDDLELRLLHARLQKENVEFISVIHTTKQIIKRWPEASEAHMLLAEAELELANESAAIASLKDCLKYEPSNAEAATLLAKLEQRRAERVARAQRTPRKRPLSANMRALQAFHGTDKLPTLDESKLEEFDKTVAPTTPRPATPAPTISEPPATVSVTPSEQRPDETAPTKTPDVESAETRPAPAVADVAKEPLPTVISEPEQVSVPSLPKAAAPSVPDTSTNVVEPSVVRSQPVPASPEPKPEPKNSTDDGWTAIERSPAKEPVPDSSNAISVPAETNTIEVPTPVAARPNQETQSPAEEREWVDIRPRPDGDVKSVDDAGPSEPVEIPQPEQAVVRVPESSTAEPERVSSDLSPTEPIASGSVENEDIFEPGKVAAAESTDRDAKLKAYLVRGNHYREKGEFASAVSEFTEALRKYPDATQLYIERSRAFAAMGEISAALKDLRIAQEHNPAYTPGWLRLGELYLEARQHQNARDVYSKIVDKDPSNITARVGRGRALSHLNDLPAALADLNVAVQSAPGNIPARVHRSYVSARMKRYDAVISDATAAIDLGSDDAILRYRRGVALVMTGRHEKAIDDLSVFLKAHPANKHALAQRAHAYSATGMYDASIADWSELLKHDPSYPQARIRRAMAATAHGKHKAALIDFTDVLTSKPDAAVYYQRALTHRRLGLDERAMDDLGSAIRLNPRHVNALEHRAMLLVGRRNLEAAISDLTQAIAAAPERSATYYNRGVLLSRTGQHEKAIDDYNTAIMMNDKLAVCYLRRGLAKQKLGRSDEAFEDYSSAIGLDQKLHQAFYYRGTLHLARKNPEDAISDLKQAIALNNNYSPTWFALAQALAKAGRADESIQALSKTIQRDSDHYLALLQRGEVYQQRGDLSKAEADFRQATIVEPKSASAWHSLAVIRATSSDAAYRNPTQAVAFARKACELTQLKRWDYLKTLATAYAESGDFAKAEQWSARAESMAPPEEKSAIRQLTNRYRSGQPVRR